ncbi:MAG TPA: hypothetical protein EYP59_16210 [Thiotrichaceae bacterium]|nr:hypothetical protein [Thiotrichaceae bacterium]
MKNPHLYVLLVFDGRYLFVPQDEIESVEIIADVQVEPTSQGAIGWFSEHHEPSPVFCLANDLSLLLELPENSEYLVLLKAKQQILGITCDEVDNINLKQEHLYLQDLAVSMKIPESPLSKLLIYQDKIVCVCSGAALVKHCLLLSERFISTQ